jgi:hypothetical protein
MTFAPLMTTSPRSPGGKWCPSLFMMLMRTSEPQPTDPGLRSAGGNGLDAI